jgi:addiction module HigA family antidote
MKLTDDFVRDVPPADTKSGRKYSDGNAMYLYVKAAGKYWRFAYRFADKQKTLALGVYPAVSLEEARQKANSARELLKGGVDPGESKKATKQVQREAATGQRPRHPGAMLRDVVLPGLSVSVESFADLLNLPFEGIFQIIHERAPMTCEVALKLERLISVKAESWLTMQQSVDLWDARTEFKRFHDFGKTLLLADLTATPESTQDGLDASNTVLVAKAVELSKAATNLAGFKATKG